MVRDKVYSIINGDTYNKSGIIYNYFMMISIVISIIPLAFKVQDSNLLFLIFDKVTVVIFIADYMLRLFTADKHLKKGAASFFIYPFTPMAIIDLLSILPSVTILASGFRLLRMFRLMRTFRVFKAFKMFRYSKSLNIIIEVIKKQKTALIAVGTFAVGYIIIAALVVFNVEPDTFKGFSEALYWATVSLTTVGFGDIYPISTAGRFVTMISSLCGIAIVAMPSGILAAGYMDALKNYSENNNDDENNDKDNIE